MTAGSLSAFFAVMVVLAAVPGASVALVVARTLAGGLRHGIFVIAGIVCADLVFLAVAVAGMAALAEVLGGFFAVVRHGAAAYLAWLGVTFLRAPAPVRGAGAPAAGRPWTGFAAGFLLTLGDVKTVLFYASLLPAIFPMKEMTWSGFVLLACLTVVGIGAAKLAYALAARRLAGARSWERLAAPWRIAVGALLVGAAIYV